MVLIWETNFSYLYFIKPWQKQRPGSSGLLAFCSMYKKVCGHKCSCFAALAS